MGARPRPLVADAIDCRWAREGPRPKAMKKIEVLAFEGCPYIDGTLSRVRAAIADTSEPPDIRVVLVQSEEQATALRFLGSPSVRVDGLDVDATARTREDYGLRCRVYPSEKGL